MIAKSLLPTTQEVNPQVYPGWRATRTIETGSLAYFVSIGCAISAIFLIGPTPQFSYTEVIAVSLAAGGLVGGLLFTILEFGGLRNDSQKASGPTRPFYKRPPPRI